MPLLQRFADFLHDLQQLEKATGPAHGSLILDAFTRHTPFGMGAVYLREGRESPLRLAAKSQKFVAPEILETDDDEVCLSPGAELVVPLRSHRDRLGVLALSREGLGSASEEDLALVRAGAAFVSTLITNQRLMQETREGDFQLKYRLWELESLYDIGLSIASTLNIEELADEILFRTISLTNARRAALFLRDRERFSLYRAFGEVRGEFLDQDLAKTLLEEGQPIVFGEGTDCVFPGCSAFIAVPIKGRNDEIFGVLAAADRETREGGIGAFEANELRLLSLFASQVSIALENARLHKQALEKQAMERELELAATIQRDILPKSIPAVDGIELATLSRPARQVGGDYHAFFERDGVLSMLVADVAGKSMPAALLVSALHAATQLLFAEGRDLGDIATELNRHIHNWSAENKFITMVMVSIDREHNFIQYVNAGHNPCYLLVNGTIDTIKAHGLPIGILAQSKYQTQTRAFPPGSAVVLYSDGINEAENISGEEFENERLEAILAAHVNDAPRKIRDILVEEVDRFVGEAPQKDDQTLVIARRA
jgi:sigma-B regulation protein RsbU (phosphoserine phosphatase)